MEFEPFGQDIIPPTAGKTTKCKMSYNLLEFSCKKSIEAFSRPEGPYRSPMPWGPLAAGGKEISIQEEYLIKIGKREQEDVYRSGRCIFFSLPYQ